MNIYSVVVSLRLAICRPVWWRVFSFHWFMCLIFQVMLVGGSFGLQKFAELRYTFSKNKKVSNQMGWPYVFSMHNLHFCKFLQILLENFKWNIHWLTTVTRSLTFENFPFEIEWFHLGTTYQIQNFVVAPSINSFKNQLDKHWSDHPMRFDPLFDWNMFMILCRQHEAAYHKR